MPPPAGAIDVDVTVQLPAPAGAIDAERTVDGTLVWDRLVEGLGVRGHSQYSNQVRIELDGDALVVRGREAHGNYEDVYGLADGRLRWSIRWLPH